MLLKLLFGYDALLNLSGLTGPLAEVVELGAAHNTMAHNFDPAYTGTVVRESPLDTDTVADAANGETLADAAALHLDNDALEVLEPLAVAFNDLDVYANGIADLELGEVCSELLFFELSDDV